MTGPVQRANLFDAVASLRGVIVVTMLYGLVHAGLRYGASPTIGIDDGTATVFAQDWAWGYAIKNPPLYDWLLRSVQAIVGPNLAAALLLKYALLTATAAFTYLAALAVMSDRRWAALTAFSLSLCYQIGWNYHEGMTHTAVLVPVVMATLWRFFRLLERGTVTAYLGFGICLGLGLLSKYNFLVLVFGLAVAGLLVPAARERVFTPRMLLALVPLVMLVTPHALWVAHHGEPTFTHSHAHQFSAHFAMRRLSLAVLDVVKAPFGFLMPLCILLPMLFPGMLRRLLVAARTLGKLGLGNNAQRVLFLVTLVSLTLIFVGSLVFGGATGHVRYMHPFFLPSVLLLMALAKDEAARVTQQRWLVAALVAGVVAVVGFRATDLYLGPPYCGRCHALERFEPLAESLEEAGADRGAILTDDQYVAGNMRRLLHTAPVAFVDPVLAYVPARWKGIASDEVAVIVRSGTDDIKRGQDLLRHVAGAPTEQPSDVLHVGTEWTGRLGTHARQSAWTIEIFKRTTG